MQGWYLLEFRIRKKWAGSPLTVMKLQLHSSCRQVIVLTMFICQLITLQCHWCWYWPWIPEVVAGLQERTHVINKCSGFGLYLPAVSPWHRFFHHCQSCQTEEFLFLPSFLPSCLPACLIWSPFLHAFFHPWKDQKRFLELIFEKAEKTTMGPDINVIFHLSSYQFHIYFFLHNTCGVSLDIQEKRTEWFISVSGHCKDLSRSGDQQGHFWHVHSNYEPATSFFSFMSTFFLMKFCRVGLFFCCCCAFWFFVLFCLVCLFFFPLCYKPWPSDINTGVFLCWWKFLGTLTA